MKICLVVDDSGIIRRVAGRMLGDLGLVSIGASDGKEALAECSEHLPDGIFLNHTLPDMDGYEFLKKLRDMPGGDKPKVVFCVAQNDVALIARALHAGANEYILKPFDRDSLRDKFQEVGLI